MGLRKLVRPNMLLKVMQYVCFSCDTFFVIPVLHLGNRYRAITSAPVSKAINDNIVLVVAYQDGTQVRKMRSI